MLKKVSLVIGLLFFVLGGQSINDSLTGDVKPVYKKQYLNDILIAEGWMKEGVKVNYWKFYQGNILSSEGHFSNGKKMGYWKYYNSSGTITAAGHFKDDMKSEWWESFNPKGEKVIECEYSKGIKNGLCIYYSDSEPYKAERYDHGRLVNSWTDYYSFIRDNS